MGLPIVSAPRQDMPAPQNLPTVRALDAVWQAFSQQRLRLPVRVWRRLQLARALDGRMLALERMAKVAPPGKVNDCSSCTDICCIGPRNTVLLRLRDIATLIDVGKTHLIASAKPSFDPQLLAARPALRRHTASAAWRRFPVLAQNAFGACKALDTAGKCTLYPHWPMSCARFPYALDTAAAEVFYSGRCQSYFIHPRNAQLVHEMAAVAVASYNERVKDALLLRFCANSLRPLGVMAYLKA